MDYEELTDFEINKMVAEAILSGWSFEGDGCNVLEDGKTIFINKDGFGWKDFCNVWNDAGPIIVENKLSIIPVEVIGADRHRYIVSSGSFFDLVCMSPDGNDNGALMFGYDKQYIDEENPLRAAMIVFLKMMEASNE